VKDSDHGQCLTDETLTEYLAGDLDPAIKAASEVHLVSCGECRTQLAHFMRVLNPDVTSEEEQALVAITAEWNRRKGPGRRPEPAVGFRWFRLALGTAAALLIAGVLSMWIGERPSEPKSAGEIVQLLLAQNRPFESRMAGEPHRPIVRTRGSEAAGVSYNVLAGEMTRLSASSHEMGRFYLLQKDFHRAIPYLQIAEGEVGASAAVHNDLGVAYLESGSFSQLQKAEQEFTHALEQDRSFSPSAFNLALFYERTNANAQAETSWKRYLEMDSKSDWAMEAKGRLQGLSR
jgi:tetratricopeptide (TPR) repeat protein